MSSLRERHERERARRDADRAAHQRRWDADRAAHQRRIRVLNLITATALTTAAFFHLLHFLKWMMQ